MPAAHAVPVCTTNKMYTGYLNRLCSKEAANERTTRTGA